MASSAIRRKAIGARKAAEHRSRSAGRKRRATQEGIPASAAHRVAMADKLLEWRAVHGRTFSWHLSQDGFVVLCAEVLLRQTRAESVPKVLSMLLGKYPDAYCLAEATQSDVVSVVAPLGFGEQRARQLRSMAAILQERHGGRVPSASGDLRALPGVGRYTAAVVEATLSGRAMGAVDENVARILSRVLGIEPSHAEARKSTNIWDAAEQVAAARPEAGARLTWAMVDLGTFVCRRRTPRCADCPLLGCCAFSQTAAEKRRSN